MASFFLFFSCPPCFFDGRLMGKLLVYNKFVQSYSQLNIISKGSPDFSTFMNCKAQSFAVILLVKCLPTVPAVSDFFLLLMK